MTLSGEGTKTLQNRALRAFLYAGTVQKQAKTIRFWSIGGGHSVKYGENEAFDFLRAPSVQTRARHTLLERRRTYLRNLNTMTGILELCDWAVVRE